MDGSGDTDRSLALRRALAFSISGLLAATGAVAASSPSPPAAAEKVDEVVVTGFSRPYTLTGKQLAAALKAYRKYRPVYSPDGQLYFQVKRQPGKRDLDGLQLTLRSGARSIPLAVDAQSRFVLPNLPGTGWRLVANRGSGALLVSPLVLSPGTSADDRKLGDMRLECEVTWVAFVRPDLPFALRVLAAMMPPCRTSRFGLYLGTERPLASASVVAGSKVTPIPLSAERRSWRYPGYDKTLPNSARVRFRYE